MKVLLFAASTSKGLRSLQLGNETFGGYWVENFVENLSSQTDVTLFCAFLTNKVKKVKLKLSDGITYIAVPMIGKKLSSSSKKTTTALNEIMDSVKPDIIHIIGTEKEAYYQVLKKFGNDKTVFSMTGIVSACSDNYFGGINKNHFLIRTLGDILRGGGPIQERRLFERIGKTENKIIKEGKYFFGRTSFDYSFIKIHNPDAHYIKCGEILNPIFFEDKWGTHKCEQHTIFVSQGSYPLKGLHKLIEAFPNVLKQFPDSKIRIAGPNILRDGSFMDRLKRTTYARYLIRLIKKNRIPKEKIIFTGSLSPIEMKKMYLQSNVFVIPSAIENSPNSLGEAMALGMPCVGSSVGGIPDMINHNKTGLLYSFDDVISLSKHICDIFKDSSLAVSLGQNASADAIRRFKSTDVIETTVELYNRLK